MLFLIFRIFQFFYILKIIMKRAKIIIIKFEMFEGCTKSKLMSQFTAKLHIATPTEIDSLFN